MKRETKCVHSGNFIDPATKGINTPIYTSSVYKYIDSGKQSYPRYFNTPNQEAVVEKLCALESAEAGILFSSGMAAISTTFLTLLDKGDHVVLQDEIYGGTHAFIINQFDKFGIEYDFVKTNAEAVGSAIKDHTRVIYVESPTNPLLTLIDLSRVAELAKEKNILIVIDNTFASPINQNPLEIGIDVVVHSGTKYLGGHSDICCGAVLSNNNIIEKIHKTAVDFGGSLNAVTCSLLERSLKTMSLRVERQTENAMNIARFLENHPQIAQTWYPGLESHTGHAIAKKQMKGFGAMVAFELSREVDSIHFLKKLKLIKPALSLGGIESTICSPALTSHKKMPAEDREKIGVTDKVLRFSAGIEHIDDITADMAQALG